MSTEEFPIPEPTVSEAVPTENSVPELLPNTVDPGVYFKSDYNVFESNKTLNQALSLAMPGLQRFIRSRVSRQGVDAESDRDILQEVMLAATLRKNADSEGMAMSAPFFRAWLYAVTKNKISDHFRRADRYRGRQIFDIDNVSEATISEVTSYEESRFDIIEGQFTTGALGVAIGELSEMQRTILFLRVIVGLSAEETAEAVHSTPGAVRVAQHRALNKLRKKLGPNRNTFIYGDDEAD